MSSNTYHIGDVVQLTANFTSVPSGQPLDASTVTFTVKAPDGTVSTPGATHVQTGMYAATITASQAGVWRYKVTGTGGAQAANKGMFVVEPDDF